MGRNNEEVNRAIYEITENLSCFHSLTLDNDIAFKKHKELSITVQKLREERNVLSNSIKSAHS